MEGSLSKAERNDYRQDVRRIKLEPIKYTDEDGRTETFCRRCGAWSDPQGAPTESGGCRHDCPVCGDTWFGCSYEDCPLYQRACPLEKVTS